MSNMRVLICGAGIAGPPLAFFLAKAGAIVTVIDKSPSMNTHGQNIDIGGSAVKVVEKMGILDEIRKHNTTEKGTQFVNTKGKAYAVLPVSGGKSASLTSEFEILRGDLAKVLYTASKDLPNVKYLFDTTIKQIISNDSTAVEARLSNNETQRYDLLVAADGQWSKTRKQIFPADSVTIHDQDMYAVYWTVPRLPTDTDWWSIYHALGSRTISTRPDPYGTYRAMLTFMPSTDEEKKEWQDASRAQPKIQKELARKHFADAGWQAQRLLAGLDTAPDFYFQAIQQIRMSQWSSNRVVCLGDAAYAPTPLTGMGAPLSITGAYVLAGELSKLQPGEHPARALASYENLYRPFVEDAQRIPSIVPGIAHPATAWKRKVLQGAEWTISKIVPLLPSREGKSSKEDFPLPKYPALQG